MLDWIKFETNFLEDERITRMMNDYNMAGLGAYLIIRSKIDMRSNHGVSMQYLKNLARMYSHSGKFLKIIMNYGLFYEDEVGLIHSCPLSPARDVPERDMPERDVPERVLISDKENIRILENNNNNNDKEPPFIKPTIPQIAEYCQQRNNGVDAGHFFDYYESKGWTVGNHKMKDWRAAVRTWERTNREIVRRTTRTVQETTEEYADESQVCFNCQPIPADAPPRPSPNAQWDFATESWSEFY